MKDNSRSLIDKLLVKRVTGEGETATENYGVRKAGGEVCWPAQRSLVFSRRWA
jgi:hypothetical protein